jgi:hypothetical protein
MFRILFLKLIDIKFKTYFYKISIANKKIINYIFKLFSLKLKVLVLLSTEFEWAERYIFVLWVKYLNGPKSFLKIM